MASFVLSFFPLDVLDEIWDLIESVSEGFLTYSYLNLKYLELFHFLSDSMATAQQSSIKSYKMNSKICISSYYKNDLLFCFKYYMGGTNSSTDQAHELRYMQKRLSAEAIDRRMGSIVSY